jgi:hypothetical protein
MKFVCLQEIIGDATEERLASFGTDGGKKTGGPTKSAKPGSD